eukprot:507338-Prorocentrum_minimum.AAC.2
MGFEVGVLLLAEQRPNCCDTSVVTYYVAEFKGNRPYFELVSDLDPLPKGTLSTERKAGWGIAGKPCTYTPFWQVPSSTNL